jgi:gentisate 1,2-dioxygenase
MEPAGQTYYDRLFEMRDKYRARTKNGIAIVSGNDLSWEDTRQGKLKWFVHPAKPDTVVKNLLVWEQEIAPGSRSGKQHVPGGVVHYIIEGSGYSIIDAATTGRRVMASASP